MSSGDLGCKVLRNAGTKLQLEYNKIINKISQIAVGSVIITSGVNFIKYIIHKNGPKSGQRNEEMNARN